MLRRRRLLETIGGQMILIFNRTLAVFYAGIVFHDGCLKSTLVVLGFVKSGVRDLKMLVRRPVKKYGLIGSDVTLECEANDFPEVRNVTSETTMIMWKKENLEVPILIKTGFHPTHTDANYRDRISIGRENSINISRLNPDDTGWYECLVVSLQSLEVPGNGSWVFLFVFAPIILKNASADVVKAEEGDRLDLFCEVSQEIQIDISTWLRNDVEIKPSERLLISALDNTIKLTFVRLESTDTAMYTCVFKNLASKASHNVHLFVQSAFPRLHGNPLKMYIPLGAMARVPCLTNHDNAAVFWTKDGQQLNQTHIKINQQGHLYIKTIQFSDQGLYICKPYSATAFHAQLTVLHIVVKVPVYFLVRPRPLYQRHANQSVTMPCVAVGDPTPTISWRKIGGSFPGKTKTLYDAGNLTVVQLSKEDQGQYECVAQNIVASVITTSLLIIEASPHSPPYNLTVRTTHDSAKICWLPAYDNGHPQHYVLWYKAVNEKNEDWTTMRIVPDDALCMTIYDLAPSTEFEFYVLSRNRLGEGLFSNSITATTKGHVKDLQAETIDQHHNHNQQQQQHHHHNHHHSHHHNNYHDHRQQQQHKVASDVDRENKNNNSDDDDDEGYESSGQDGPPAGTKRTNVDGAPFHDQQSIVALVYGLTRPLPPQNISALKTKEGLYISWLPPITPVEHYLIQYKTKGHWVTLSDHVKKTYFNWLTPSFGASYQFRVISFSKNQMQSEPSPVVMLDTGNPMLSESNVSTKMVATLFGVIILVLLLLGSTLTLIRSCAPKRQQSSIRYDSVKYFGPSQLEPSQKILPVKQKSEETETSSSACDHHQEVKKSSTQQLQHSSLVQLSPRPQTDVDSLSEQCTYVNCTNRKVILETPI